MKFRKPNKDEIELIKKCVEHFNGNLEINKFSLFVNKFNRVFIYNGKKLKLNALSIGLNIGKFTKNIFMPNRQFLDLINPTHNIFEIENKDAINFMKGFDIYPETKAKEKYKIYTEKKLNNFEENTFVAIKCEGIILGTGIFKDGKIINKISKREKLH